MAKKIEGLAIQLGNRKWRFSEDSGAPMATERRSTIVIHEGKHERVFTESEVMAMVNDLFKANADPGSFTERHREMHPKAGHYAYEETVPQWVSRAKAIVRKNHGLSRA